MDAIAQTAVSKTNFLELKGAKFIKISPEFVPKGPINNVPALVQAMAWSHFHGTIKESFTFYRM